MDEKSRAELLEAVGTRKLPIYGIKGSGKTTFVRNVRCQSGFKYFSDGDLLTYKELLQNMAEDTLYKAVKSAGDIVRAARARKDPQALDEECCNRVKGAMKRYSEYYKAMRDPEKSSKPNIKAAYGDMEVIWKFNPVRVWVEENLDNLPNGIVWVLDNKLCHIMQSDWRPDIEDILQMDLSMIPVIPGSEIILGNPDGRKMLLYDMGGDKHLDWSKYKTLMDECVAIMVFVSLGDFDVIDPETQSNVFDNHIRGFWHLAEDTTLEGMHFIVILNKGDAFKEKIQKDINPRHCCSAFDGYNGPNEFDHLIGYVADLFKARNDKAGRVVSCYLSHSQNKENLENLFKIADHFVNLKKWTDIVTAPEKKCKVM